MNKKKKTTNRYHSNKPSTNIKKASPLAIVSGILAIIVVFVLVISLIHVEHYPNEVSHDINYEEHLLEAVADYDRRLDDIYISKITKEIHDIDGSGLVEHLIVYTEPYGNRLSLNTREQNLARAEGDGSEFGRFEFVSLNEKENEAIQAAKEHVIAFIKASSFLRDKDFLIEKIQSVPFYKYSYVEHDVDGEMYTSVATTINDSVYINEKCAKSFCTYVATHELLHVLINTTNNGAFIYQSTLLEEALMDALANVINPCYCENQDAHYGYSELFAILYQYLNLFGIEAVESAFYGYDAMFAKYGGDSFILEHDAFVSAMLGYYEDEYMSYILTSHIIENWRRNLE